MSLDVREIRARARAARLGCPLLHRQPGRLPRLFSGRRPGYTGLDPACAAVELPQGPGFSLSFDFELPSHGPRLLPDPLPVCRSFLQAVRRRVAATPFPLRGADPAAAAQPRLQVARSDLRHVGLPLPSCHVCGPLAADVRLRRALRPVRGGMRARLSRPPLGARAGLLLARLQVQGTGHHAAGGPLLLRALAGRPQVPPADPVRVRLTALRRAGAGPE